EKIGTKRFRYPPREVHIISYNSKITPVKPLKSLSAAEPGWFFILESKKQQRKRFRNREMEYNKKEETGG
ncbi:MAG: hypothetical protein ACOX8G_11635, partial [Eubacterium sp.]